MDNVERGCKKIRCSWCGKPIRTEDLEKVKEKHADFRFFCRFCNATRYMRESDIFGENRR